VSRKTRLMFEKNTLSLHYYRAHALGVKS